VELENPWGSADGSFRPFALRSGEAVARLFLPLISHVDDSRIPWAEYLARRGIPLSDGYTEWSVVSELSGTGGDRRDSGFSPAPGSADTGTIAAVIDALERTGYDATRWNALVDPVFDGPSSVTTYSLNELARRWEAHPFPGRLWCENPEIGLASPAYADSIIVSGSAELIEQLRANQLEIFRVAASHPLPMMIL
jgi:hypothetical protein